jgi:hypothetical protein
MLTDELTSFIYLFQSIILPLGVGNGKDVQAYGLKTWRLWELDKLRLGEEVYALVNRLY